MRQTPILLAGALALALSACTTTDLGVPVPGSYPSGGTSYPQQQQGQLVAGQVADVDHQNARFLLATDGYSSQRVELRYDQNTRTVYNGQQVNTAGLERGDRIRADVVQTQGVWYARQIDVTQDVRGTQPGNYPYPGGGAADLTGAISSVDTRNQLITYTRGGYAGSSAQVRYDNYTIVEYQGRQYRPENLQRGDTVRIVLRNTSGGTPVADRVIVEVAAGTR